MVSRGDDSSGSACRCPMFSLGAADNQETRKRTRIIHARRITRLRLVKPPTLFNACAPRDVVRRACQFLSVTRVTRRPLGGRLGFRSRYTDSANNGNSQCTKYTARNHSLPRSLGCGPPRGGLTGGTFRSRLGETLMSHNPGSVNTNIVSHVHRQLVVPATSVGRRDDESLAGPH
jgi:hypothetical protein